MCPRDKNFVEVDEKIYWVEDENSPSFVSFGTEKNIINKKMIRKNQILCGVLIWVYMLIKKNSSHFEIGGVYMLHPLLSHSTHRKI